MASEKAVKLINKVLNEGRFHDKDIEVADKSVKDDLETALKDKDIKKLRDLRARYEKALKYIEEAKTLKHVENGKYWEAPEWILAVLSTIVLSPVGAAITAYMSSRKTKFTKDELEKMEESLKKAHAKVEEFFAKEKEATHEAAVKLIEQVLKEGRYQDNAIKKAEVKAEYDLDKAIENGDEKTVKKLKAQYEKARGLIKAARGKKKLPDGKHYWEVPEWLLFLLAPWPLSAGIITYTTSQKTKFTDEELDKIDATLEKAIEKCDKFLEK